jgi:hypothetical protein
MTISHSKSLFFAAGLLLGAVVAVAAESTPSTPVDQDGSARIPAEMLLDEIKQTPYAGRAKLRERLNVAEKRMDDRMPEWEARKNSLPEKERIAAEMEFKQLKRSREVLRQKIDGVDFSSEETWNSAKGDLYVVLLDAVQTYKKLRARFPS